MKLNYSYQQIASLISSETTNHSTIIYTVEYDSRRILNGENTLFLALSGNFRNGHEFIADAYKKGVRHFVVSEKGSTKNLKGAYEIVVDDVLLALEKLAIFHRNKFKCPVIAITGSNGKTTVKEWLTYLISGENNVARSPKSYNSTIGVALSLLQINENTDVAIIEVGIGKKGTIQRKLEMIKPTDGIFTSFGKAHSELFISEEEKLNEKLILFKDVNSFIYSKSISKLKVENGTPIAIADYEEFLKKFNLKDYTSQQNVCLAIAMSLRLGISKRELVERIKDLSPLALRLESFDGVNGNTIINDTYNLDLDSLENSLSYQLANCNGKDRVVIIGMHKRNKSLEKAIKKQIENFGPIDLKFQLPEGKAIINVKNTSILIKGTRQAKMEILAQQLKQQNHQTYLEIDLKAIRHNINYFKSKIENSTKLLCMVKASSYGSDAKTMGLFLEQIGVDYLGVAYVNEGVELRNKGVKLPILVMNCEEQSFSECIDNQLEPAIFSLKQLDSFIRQLIGFQKLNYPIHLKLETGMKRLGFEKSEISELISSIKSQPEIHVQSIYSHLAESDVVDSDFTRGQLKTFEKLSAKIQEEIPYPILRHLLNSEGIINYSSAQFDMVRLGIGMYGVTENTSLRQSISWISKVSQVKKLSKGESVGYGRSFVATNEMTIAIVPIGYADGLRRSLSQGVGGVYIQNDYCPIVGNVCMDMIMVDVTQKEIGEGCEVEIIGKHQSVRDIAKKMNTIPYEVMTSFSSRLHRIYLA